MKDRYQGIDFFRIIAAAMVVGIHTFPFSSISPKLDELITLTVFRVAVPFFFMTTGYFLMGKLSLQQSYLNRKGVQSFLIKILKLYVIAILLFLPLSFYTGTISTGTSLVKGGSAFFFEGTFYHLWYFPAVIIGVLLVTYLLRLMSFSGVMMISFLLYLIGLGGDSWYGWIKGIEFVSTFYSSLFKVFPLTRNGLFFTPLYLCLGIYLYRKGKTKNIKEIPFFLVLSLMLMLIESYFLHTYTEIKHDSMYFLLPFVMLFLYQLLLRWQPKIKWKTKEELPLFIYVIHPLVIVVIHTISSRILFLKISLIYYLLVLCGSWLLSVFYLHLKGKKKEISPVPFRAEKKILKEAVTHNVSEINKIIPRKTKIIGVVKANAYGCDLVGFSQLLLKEGIDFLAVATIDEAIKLRKAGIASDILILGYTDPKRVEEIAFYDLIQSVISEEHGRLLNIRKMAIRCHLQLDTGMHRLGMQPELGAVVGMYQLPYLKIEGIYSHLGSADLLDEFSVNRTKGQIESYQAVLKGLKDLGIDYGVTHIQSSYGILNYPELNFDYVRAGIILYGFLSDSIQEPKQKIDLKPVLEVKAKLISKRYVKANEYVGYGTNYQLTKETLIGVVSIGYADGLPRSLSNQDLFLMCQDKRMTQIGNICMDMLLVDLSQAEDVPLNSEVTILSSDNIEQIVTDEGTLTNELLSRLGERLTTDIIN
ncbi:membrane-bound serine racemase VanT [Vagococcus carniphilus]|uniref:membrane-bound serine racemase VanT n=1 Tax=Vagococcus carniphilus TaxID=218144 RepID=UPI003B5AA12B